MNGSRANPKARRDIFQDFDIIYVATDVSPFKNNCEWIKRFGEVMIMQMPEEIFLAILANSENTSVNISIRNYGICFKKHIPMPTTKTHG